MSTHRVNFKSQDLKQSLTELCLEARTRIKRSYPD
jgi:hypothetical protein